MAGIKGRSGRKPRSAEFGLAALLERVWKIEDREEVIRTLHRNAVAGNDKAASILLAYAYGKPSEHVKVEVFDPAKLAAETVSELQSEFSLPLEQARAIVLGTFGDVLESNQVS